MSKIIGIDLGTTNSCVAVMEAGKPKVIPSAEGRNIIPSVVEPVKNLVGEVAKRQMILNPENTIYSIKRLMGRRFADAEVKKTQKMVPYNVKSGKDGMAVVEVGGKEFTPQEISAKILAKCKADAEAFLGEKSRKQLLPFPLILMMPKDKQLNRQEKLPDLKLKESLMNQRLPLWLMVWKRKKGKQLLFMIWGEEHLIFQF